MIPEIQGQMWHYPPAGGYIRVKLPQRGPGQSPAAEASFVYFETRKRSNGMILVLSAYVQADA